MAKKMLKKKNKFGESPLETLRVNLEKIKKLKNPNSEVHQDTVLDYIVDKSVKPFSLDGNGNYRFKRGTSHVEPSRPLKMKRNTVQVL